MTEESAEELRDRANQLQETAQAWAPAGTKVYVHLPGMPPPVFSADTSRWPTVIITDPDGVQTTVEPDLPPPDAPTMTEHLEHFPDGEHRTDIGPNDPAPIV